MDILFSSLTKICELFPVGSRSFIEGEAVFKAKHVVLCGIDARNKSKILAYVLKTSALDEWPHCVEISGVASRKCSCKAGAGGHCKHICGVFLFIYNLGFENLEVISQTTLQREWGKIKKDNPKNKPHTLADLCHVPQHALKKYKSGNEMDKEDLKNLVMQRLILAKPGSIACLHIKGRNRIPVQENLEGVVLQRSLAHAILARNLDLPEELRYCNLPTALFQFYEEKVALRLETSVDLLMLVQRSRRWFEARRRRVTASAAYPIYTFALKKRSQKVWTEKMEKLSSFKGNRFTNHGLKWEEPARKLVEVDLNCTVEEVGLVCRPMLPWLAGSPDGIIWSSDGPILIEIKCPISGKKGPVDLAKLKYLKVDAGNYYLQHRSTYYAQMQINMVLTGCSRAYLVLFSSKLRENIYFPVDYDRDYTEQILFVLKEVYFKHLLFYFRSKD